MHPSSPPTRVHPLFVACALACAPTAVFACDATDTTSLAACIANAAPGDTVRLRNNITLTSHTGLISTDITIDGQGFTLDGAGTHRGFFVDRGTVTVQNITLQNLRAKGGDGGAGSHDERFGPGGGGGMGAGGALFVRSGAAVVLRDVNLSGSQAVGGAGGQARYGSSVNSDLKAGAGGGLGGAGAGAPDATAAYAGHGGGGTFDPGNDPVVGASPAGFTSRGGNGGGPAGGVGHHYSIPGGAGAGGEHSGGGGGSVVAYRSPAGDGGFGGGGGSSPGGEGGNGGFGGGAGASGTYGPDLLPAATAGFGGGGAGRNGRTALNVAAAPGGFGGGDGGVNQYTEITRGQYRYDRAGGGGGGAGMGGAIFVMEGASISFEGRVNLNGNTVAGGQGGNRDSDGGTDGRAFGPGIFLQGRSAVIVFNPSAGAVQTLTDGMADQSGSGGTGVDAGSIGIAKTGAGLLVLDGDHRYSGGTTVDAGRLAVNGRIPGATTVRAGGELGGTGTVGSTRVQAGGRLAPGNAIGTLTVNGDLAFAPGSVFDVEVTPAQSDRVDVSGTVTLSGGTVQVRAGEGSYARMTEHNILTAAAGLSGTFDNVSTDLAFLAPTLVYGPNGLVLRLSTHDALRYEHVASTDNQVAVARHLDAFAAAPPHAQAQDLIDAMDNMTAAQAVVALTGLSGSAHGAATWAASEVGASFARALAERSGAGLADPNQSAPALALRLQTARRAHPVPAWRAASEPGATAPSGPTTWVRTVGAGASLPGDGNGPSSHHSATGVVVGQDAWINPSWWLGAALGNSRARWHAHTDGSAAASGHIQSWSAGLYAHHHWGEQRQWRLRLDTGWTLHRFDTHRALNLGATALSAASLHRGREIAVGSQIEHALPVGAEGSGWQLLSSAGLRRAHLREHAFDETGAMGANLAVRPVSFRGTVASAGVRWVYSGEQGHNLHLGLEASRRVGDLQPWTSASLVGQSGPFVVAGTPLRPNALTLRVGGSWPLSSHLSLHGGASGQWRGGSQNSHEVSLGLRMVW